MLELRVIEHNYLYLRVINHLSRTFKSRYVHLLKYNILYCIIYVCTPSKIGLFIGG